MKALSVLLPSLLLLSAAPTLPQLKPEVGPLLSFTRQEIADYNSPANFARCDEKLAEMKKAGKTYNNLTPAEKSLFFHCDEVRETIWQIDSDACSFYCGDVRYTVEASSSLPGQGANSYSSQMASDMAYSTAWVEGVEGYGIGESLTYTFHPAHPRINKIIIVNGYVKSAAAFRNNARVKKLQMYVNGTPRAILALEDLPAGQSFTVSPIGYADREDMDLLKTRKEWKVRFEIMEVYPGAKYEDTAITEIYFDGMDVH